MTERDEILKQICLDTERERRIGMSESLFCEGKNFEQVVTILNQQVQEGKNVLGTRCPPEWGEELTKQFQGLGYHPLSRTFQLRTKPPVARPGRLGILAAGTSDVPVAEEAYHTAMFYGVEPIRFYDVGVAGLHRLLSQLEEIKKMDVVIVVAGMDGALPSVVGGLVRAPVIACPTSVGYGTHFKGLTTLHTMLNSCAEGITVVNIDNGFGAACAALRIFFTNFTKKV